MIFDPKVNKRSNNSGNWQRKAGMMPADVWDLRDDYHNHVGEVGGVEARVVAETDWELGESQTALWSVLACRQLNTLSLSSSPSSSKALDESVWVFLDWVCLHITATCGHGNFFLSSYISPSLRLNLSLPLDFHLGFMHLLHISLKFLHLSCFLSKFYSCFCTL